MMHKKVQRFIQYFYNYEDFMQGVRKLSYSDFPLHGVQRVHHVDVQQLRAHGGRHPQPQLLQGADRKARNRQRNKGIILDLLRLFPGHLPSRILLGVRIRSRLLSQLAAGRVVQRLVALERVLPLCAHVYNAAPSLIRITEPPALTPTHQTMRPAHLANGRHC